MQHLTLEALARLVDEAPLADEAAHLSSCLACRRELGEMRAQTAALGALDDPEAPAGAWPALEATLRAEGLIVDIPRRVEVARVPLWRRTSFLRAAAAVAIFVAGGAIGMMLRGSGAAPRVATNEPTLGPPMVARPPAVAAVPVASGQDGPLVVESPDPSPNGARMASATGGETAAPRPADPAVRRARAELAEAEDAWVAALQRYAAIADPSSGADPGTRMAALERMIATTGAALERAPDDPVINGYHMAALRERESLRRDLAAAEKDWF